MEQMIKSQIIKNILKLQISKHDYGIFDPKRVRVVKTINLSKVAVV